MLVVDSPLLVPATLLPARLAASNFRSTLRYFRAADPRALPRPSGLQSLVVSLETKRSQPFLSRILASGQSFLLESDPTAIATDRADTRSVKKLRNFQE